MNFLDRLESAFMRAKWIDDIPEFIGSLIPVACAAPEQTWIPPNTGSPQPTPPEPQIAEASQPVPQDARAATDGTSTYVPPEQKNNAMSCLDALKAQFDLRVRNAGGKDVVHVLAPMPYYLNACEDARDPAAVAKCVDDRTDSGSTDTDGCFRK